MALMIARGADSLSIFDKPRRDALVMLLVRLHDHQNTAAEMLCGLWLIPLGLLVYRSRLLPRFLGVWLVINGITYAIISLIGELVPQYSHDPFRVARPALLGEMAFMLWPVIMGSKREPWYGVTSSPAVA
jgi:hypothetical protein